MVDPSAIIAIALNEPDADRLLGVLVDADAASISAPSVLELDIVIKSKTQQRGQSALEVLRQLSIDVVPFTEDHLAEAIAAYGMYGKGNHPAGLNFGDCFSYALARSLSAPLLFKGADFAKTDIVPALS